MQATRHYSILNLWLGVILFVALVLRLVYALAQDPGEAFDTSGADSWWYLQVGADLVNGRSPAPLPTAPLYPLLLGFAQEVFAPNTAVIVLRMLQALLSTAYCYFAYRLALMLTDKPRAGVLAAGVLAVSPVFVIEAAMITTETLYIFLLLGGLVAYISLVKQPADSRLTIVRLVAAALLFALATLTRAVLILFPLGLALHLLLVYGWREGLKRAALLLIVYVLVISVWTAHNWIKWRRVVIGAQGFASFLYLGASEEGWQGAVETDQQLAEVLPELDEINAQTQQEVFTNSAADIISENPLAYAQRRVSNLADSYLQPHGTVFFPGESLRALVSDWWRTDRTYGGLVQLTTADAFWPKLLIYVLHFVGIVEGLIGMWRTRHNWRVALPLIGFVAYTSLLHLALLALPRYIFPTEVIWWVFAAGAFFSPSAFQPVSSQPKVISGQSSVISSG